MQPRRALEVLDVGLEVGVVVVEVVLHEVGQPVGERGGLRGRGGQARNVVLFIGDGMGPR
jgi:alkaline phosphatase